MTDFLIRRVQDVSAGAFFLALMALAAKAIIFISGG